MDELGVGDGLSGVEVDEVDQLVHLVWRQQVTIKIVMQQTPQVVTRYTLSSVYELHTWPPVYQSINQPIN